MARGRFSNRNSRSAIDIYALRNKQRLKFREDYTDMIPPAPPSDAINEARRLKKKIRLKKELED